MGGRSRSNDAVKSSTGTLSLAATADSERLMHCDFAKFAVLEVDGTRGTRERRPKNTLVASRHPMLGDHFQAGRKTALSLDNATQRLMDLQTTPHRMPGD